MGKILAPGAEAVLAEFQIADEVEPEPVILDRGEPVIEADIADQPAGGVEVAPPGQPVADPARERAEKTLFVLFQRVTLGNNTIIHA